MSPDKESPAVSCREKPSKVLMRLVGLEPGTQYYFLVDIPVFLVYLGKQNGERVKRPTGVMVFIVSN